MNNRKFPEHSAKDSKSMLKFEIGVREVGKEITQTDR